MSWEKREILLVVKTYPSRSKKYGNTVCTAGILEDTNEWVRLYPIRYERFLKLNLKKFIRFEAEIQRDTSDYLQRKESYKIRENSINIVDDSLTLPSVEGVWDERTRILQNISSNSAEELTENYNYDRTSLGIISPNINTVKFRIRKPISEIEIEREITTQFNLFGEKIAKVDEIEKAFSYKFHCNEDSCKGHDKICEDWELLEAFRKWKHYYPDEKVFKKKLIEKFDDWMTQRELYFVMGTHWRFPVWIIIGLYYPPKKEKRKKPSNIFVL